MDAKSRAGLEVAAGYALALAAMWCWLGDGLEEFGFEPLFRMAAAHLIAALIIFMFGLARSNSSLFDPYWSVIPVATALWFADVSEVASWGPRHWTIIGLVIWWGGRLTFNWWRGWRGMKHEDWRYVQLRDRWGRRFWFINLFGIHLFPCALVFLGCIPLWVALGPQAGTFVPLDILAIVVTVGAITIESAADRQLWDWRCTMPAPEAYMTQGLWTYSRHPNYFGEASFWWGLWIFAMALSFTHAWMVVGAVGMTLLFLCISIPLMERRTLARRPHYAEHIERTSMFVPLPPKSSS